MSGRSGEGAASGGSGEGAASGGSRENLDGSRVLATTPLPSNPCRCSQVSLTKII